MVTSWKRKNKVISPSNFSSKLSPWRDIRQRIRQIVDNNIRISHRMMYNRSWDSKESRAAFKDPMPVFGKSNASHKPTTA